MSDPLLSVVIPVYNGEKYLAEAITSVLKQSYRPIEIIVVDDGSTDASLRIAQGFGDAVRCHTQPHAGAASARNRGVGLAAGEYLAFLDADDLWAEKKIERQMAIALEGAADIVFTYIRNFVSPELSDDVKNKIECRAEAMAGFSPTTLLIAHAAFHRAGPFDTSWRVGEFIDWYSKARDTGLKTAVVEEVLALRRLHDGNQGVVNRDARSDYLRIVKASTERRRSRS